MRTTLNIDDSLMLRVKQMAAESNRTITEVIEGILRREFSGQKIEHESFTLEWVTVSGRLQPGVDLSDRDSLLEVMEGRS